MCPQGGAVLGNWKVQISRQPVLGRDCHSCRQLVTHLSVSRSIKMVSSQCRASWGLVKPELAFEGWKGRGPWGQELTKLQRSPLADL